VVSLENNLIREAGKNLSSETLNSIIAFIPNILFVHRGGKVLFTNDETIKITGYARDEIVGRNILDFVVEEDWDAVRDSLRKRENGEAAERYEITAVIKNGSLKRVVVKSNTILFENEPAILTVLNDLTDFNLAQKENIKKEKLLTAAADAAEILLINQNINTAISETLKLIGSAIDSDRAYLFAKSTNNEEGSESINQLFEWTSQYAEPTINDPELQNFQLDKFGDFFAPLYQRKFINGFPREFGKAASELLTGHNIKSLIIFPIYIKDNLWGFVGFDDCRNERIWEEAEEAALFSYAAAIAGALERKQNEVDLLQAKDLADRGNRAKSEFLANMSHEIRTPLNAILGFAELLQDVTNDEKYLHYLNGIKSSGKGLLKIINDILDLSKIEAGKTALEPEAVNISLMLSEIKNMFLGLAIDKRITFTVKIEQNVPKIIYLDETRLRQILLNLIGNAIKFTNFGSVKVSIYAIMKNYSNRIDLIFEIADTGMGIPLDQQEIIFEAFKQVDSDNKRNFGGTGLGLTITKRLVEMMNGRIFLKSELGKGSTFKVQIYDLKFSNAAPFVHDSSQTSLLKSIKFNNPLVLIAEDVDSNRTLIAEFLKNRNVRIVYAMDGREAIDLAKKEKPDLILMDIQMPEIDGFDAANIIKEHFGNDNVPIIAITAAFLDQDKKASSSFDAIIAKPVSRMELLAEMNRFLPSTMGNQQKDTVPTPASDISPSLSEKQREELAKIFNDDLCRKYQTIKHTILIDEVIEFADIIINTGRKFNIVFLENHGNMIKQYAETFRIEPLKKAIESFDDIINLILNPKREQ
jgi:PAS domain S-box-containing protein